MSLASKTFYLSLNLDITTVVLITSSEGCSVQTKAIIASSLEPKDVVRHLIVYRKDPNEKHHDEDDDSSGSHYYDPSFDDHADVKVKLSVLYVSFSDGIGMFCICVIILFFRYL